MVYVVPVSTDTLHYIHNVGDLLEESVPSCRGVYWGGNCEKLKFLIDQQLIGPQNIRFFVGYAGWTKDHWWEELGFASWFLAEGAPLFVFRFQAQRLCKKVLIVKGIPYEFFFELPDQSFGNYYLVVFKNLGY